MLDCVDGVVDAIRRLAVRGAPAIGVAGAYGVALATMLHDPRDGDARFDADVAALRSARPTPANLPRMVDRVAAVSGRRAILAEAHAVRDEEVAASSAMVARTA